MAGVGRSLGSGPTYPVQGPDAALNVALDNSAASGIVVAIAAGNSGGLWQAGL